MTSVKDTYKKGNDIIDAEDFNSLEEFIKSVISKELSINISEVDVNRSFIELGVTSMMSLSIRNSIEKRVGFPVSSTLLFNYNTVKNISDHLSSLASNKENMEEEDELLFSSDRDKLEYDYYSEEEIFELLKNELGGE